jgi:hypothetical protein
MSELTLVENGERAGYVNTDTGEWEYNGDDPFLTGLLNSLLSNGEAANIEENIQNAPIPPETLEISTESGEEIRFRTE